MKNVLTIPSIVAGSKNGGGAGGTTNYDNLTNKPKVNGIVLSGNKTSADLGITTLTPFPSTWPTTGQFEDLLAAIREDTIAVKGASFLGEVTFDDLPANLGNAEIKVEILEGTTPATKVIHSVITSGNREPYHWEYTSWNNGNSNSGWISFQLPLTAGDGISIENNVISATGGADVPEDVYTQSNLLAGKGIEIVNEPVDGGIDKHTLACWHFDDNTNYITGSGEVKESTIVRGSASIDSSFHKFGTGSVKSADGEGAKIRTIQLSLAQSFTYDFWLLKRGPSNYSEGIGFYNNYARNTFSYLVYKDTPDTAAFYVEGKDTVNVDISEINSDSWYHVALVYDASSDKGVGKLFINGVLKATIIDITKNTNTLPYTLISPGIGCYMDELRISDIARPLNPDGKFPVPTRPYSLAVPTGNKVVNNTITKTSQLTNDSGFITSVPVATTTIVGGVKPDGTSITATADGTISAVSNVPSNMMTTDTFQEVSARKDFLDEVQLKSGARLYGSIVLSNGATAISAVGSGVMLSDYTSPAEVWCSKFNINTVNPNSGGQGPATLNGKQIATVDDIAAASSSVASVNTKTGNVVLTGADIQTTYTYNSKETTTTINAFADAVFHNIDNVTALIPTKAVTSDNVTKIVKLTQAEYDSLTTKDENTLYYIVG